MDLRACVQQCMLSVPIPEIKLGISDFSTTYHCHGQIIGRKQEMEMLQAVLNRVSSTKKSEIITLNGASGSGKVTPPPPLCFLLTYY